ncbi:MAG: PHP domain-containing protein [Candidatus Absconditabacteria bacterium]|nr:PHP domain-containing protein [Candidatus Absconditabacteria bacterium]
MFIHLHGHSTFSFLEAIGKPAKIAARAKELGMSSIAITDYNGMFGAIKFFQACKDEGIKPIIGVELGFVLDVSSTNPVDSIGNLVLLAKTTKGYSSLLELTSYANTIGVKNKPKVDLAALRNFSDGIVCFFGGIQSWIGKMILRDEPREKIIEIIRMLQSILGEDAVYGEIIAQLHSENKELERVNQYIFELCQELDILCIVNSNYHYIKKTDKEAWEVALAVKDAKKIYENDRRQPKGEYYIMEKEDVVEILEKNGYNLDQIEKMISNNLKLAESFAVDIALGQVLFPNYESPESILEIYEKVKNDLIENVD